MSYMPLTSAILLGLLAGGGGGGGGATAAGGQLAIVNPNAPAAADDGDLQTPFVTLQAWITAVQTTATAESATGDAPYESAVQKRLWSVLVAPGIYDEDLSFPPGLSFRLIALGQITLGNGADPSLVSTNARNVVWDVDPGAEPANNIRPTLQLTTAAIGPTSSTHTAYACGWDVSGAMTLTDTSGGGGTTTELHLSQVKIRGDLTFNKPGITNVYLDNCFMDQAVATLQGTPNLVWVRETEFDGAVTVNSLSRMEFCQLQGDWTVTAIADFVPPNGQIGCTYTPGITWTGPALSFIVDAYSNAKSKVGAGVTLAGGATKQIIGDVTP